MTNNNSTIYGSNVNRTSYDSNMLSMQPLWLPKWMLNNILLAFVVIIAAVAIPFMQQSMDWYNWVLNIFGISCFCYFSHSLPKKWGRYSRKSFEKNIFWITIILRLIWILFFSQLTFWLWNTPWEQPEGTTMDSTGYYHTAIWFASMMQDGTFWTEISHMAATSGIADLGYPIILAILQVFGLDSIIWTRIPNCIFEAIVCLMIYRIGTRNFGESVGRLGAIFTMLMPLTFMYAGITMKESAMIMLYMICINHMDQIVRGEKKGFWHILGAIGLVGCVSLFRTSMALILIAAFLLGLILTENKRSKWVNRLLILLLVIVVGVMFLGEFFVVQVSEIQSSLEMSESNFEVRSRGNALVKNFSKAMFAPMIFTVPFPTLVDIPGQTWQQLCSGGNFIKNIMSYMVIICFILLLLQNKWRPYTFLIAVLCGYLLSLVMSSFAHSGRFHEPAVPLELMFAAAAMSLYPKQIKRLWKPALFFEVLVVVVWNWFKLKGRGLA